MTGQVEHDFIRFWEQTCDKVSAYMFCACNNRSDTEDLVQECYLRALRNWRSFNGQGSRRAWLFAIAKNTQADWYRARARRSGPLEPLPTGESHDSTFEDVEVAWRVVEDLDPYHRQIIHLRFAADLSYAEIADILHVPVGTVRSRLHRALKAVRDRMEKQNDER